MKFYILGGVADPEIGYPVFVISGLIALAHLGHDLSFVMRVK